MPAFGLMAASSLAILVAAFTAFSSVRAPKGLPVRLVKIGALETEHFSVEPVVIEISGTSRNGPPVIYVNSKETPWDELESRARSERKAGSQWLAHVQSENNASWGDVVKVIDVVEGLQADVVLLTIVRACKLIRSN